MGNYLETIPNEQRLPNGTYAGLWYRLDVLLENVQGRSYNIKVTKYQRTPAVPVTVKVEEGLIDIYLGELKP